MQERDEAGTSSRFDRQQKKREATSLLTSPLLGGGYLRRPMVLTVGVVTLRALCLERDEAAPSRQERQQKNEGAAVLTVTPS